MIGGTSGRSSNVANTNPSAFILAAYEVEHSDSCYEQPGQTEKH